MSENKARNLKAQVEELTSKVESLNLEKKTLKSKVKSLKKGKAALKDDLEAASSENQKLKTDYDDLQKKCLIVGDRRLASDKRCYNVYRSSLQQELSYLSAIEHLLNENEEHMSSANFNVYVDYYNKSVEKRKQNMARFHEEKNACAAMWSEAGKSFIIEDLKDEREPPLLQEVESGDDEEETKSDAAEEDASKSVQVPEVNPTPTTEDGTNTVQGEAPPKK